MTYRPMDFYKRNKVEAHLGLEAPVLTPRSEAAGGLRDLVALARPRQWVKNAVCFAALVFAGRLDHATAVALASVTFIAFCFASSAVYVLNDVIDRAEDRAHPVKRRRAVAAGRVGPGTALVESALLAAAAVGVSLALVPRARAVVATYLVLQVAYSFVLKRVAIVDVMAIAVGFVLRVQAGIEVIGSPQSAWILLTMFFVALLLGIGKRRSELAQLPDEAYGRRPVLVAHDARQAARIRRGRDRVPPARRPRWHGMAAGRV